MSGYVESHCAEYGVGLIRLMGRDAGQLFKFGDLNIYKLLDLLP